MSSFNIPTPQTQEDAYALITRELYFKRDTCPDFHYAVDVLDRYVQTKRRSGRSDVELQTKLDQLERKLRRSPNAPIAWLDQVFHETHSRTNVYPSCDSSVASVRLNWKSLPLRRSSGDSTSASASASSSSIRRWAEAQEWNEAPPAYTN